MKSPIVCLLLAAAVGCQQNPSKLDSVAGATASAPKAVAAEGTTTTTPAADLPKDVEGRLARVEKRLDKVIGILEQAGAARSEPDPNVTYSVPLDELDPQEGPKDAKVTIVEGFEFLCPYCYMANPTVDQIRAKYPKDVRIVAKYLIIHGQPAVAPGMAACAAAKQGKYTQMKSAIWNHYFKTEEGRPKMQQDQIGEANLDKIATEAGLDLAKLKTDMESCQGWLRSSQSALQPVGVNATPAFFVNGRPLSGAQPFEVFDKVIQEELAKADKAIADGTPQADLYNQIVAKGEKKVKGPFED